MLELVWDLLQTTVKTELLFQLIHGKTKLARRARHIFWGTLLVLGAGFLASFGVGLVLLALFFFLASSVPIARAALITGVIAVLVGVVLGVEGIQLMRR